MRSLGDLLALIFLRRAESETRFDVTDRNRLKERRLTDIEVKETLIYYTFYNNYSFYSPGKETVHLAQ